MEIPIREHRVKDPSHGVEVNNIESNLPVPAEPPLDLGGDLEDRHPPPASPRIMGRDAVGETR